MLNIVERIKRAINKKAFTMIFMKFMMFVVVFIAFNTIITSVLTQKIKENVTDSYALTLNSVSNVVSQSVQQLMDTSNLVYLNDEVFELYYDYRADTEKDVAKIQKISEVLIDYKNISPLIDSVAIVDQGRGNIYSNSGKNDMDTFFSVSNLYKDYPVNYWKDKKPSPFGRETLPLTVKNGKYVIPIIIGGKVGSGFSRFMLVDIDCRKLMKDILENVSDSNNLKSPNIYIYNAESHVAITNNDSDENLGLFEKTDFVDKLNEHDSFVYKFKGNEYLIVKSIGKSSIVKNYEYISMMPMNVLMESTSKTKLTLIFGNIIMAVLMLVIAFYNSAAVYKPIANMRRQIMRVTKEDEANEEGSNEVEFLLSGMKNIINKNIDLKQELDAVLPMASQQYLMRFLENDNGDMADTLEDMLRRGGIEFIHDSFVVAYVRFRFTEKFYDDFTGETYAELLKTLEDFFKNLFDDYESVVVSRKKDSLALILNVPNDKDAYDIVTEVLNDSVKAFDNDKEYLIVKIAVSGMHNGIVGMRKAYRESKNTGAMQISSYANEVDVYNADEKAEAKITYTIDDDNKIYHCIIKGDTEQTEDVVEQLLKRNIGNGINEKQIKQLYRDIYSTIIKALSTKKVSESALMQDHYKEADIYFDISDTDDWILYVETLLKEAVKYSNLSSTNLDIEGITAYIEENHTSDIYLEVVAEKFDTTSKYLSKIFKQYTGVNFAEYVIQLRIETAKKLLSETDKRVNDIVEECGFFNRNTFLRNFKKYVGVLPSEYRKMASENSDK